MTSIVDAAARERALDLNQSFCVRAPAGSGKTGLLINRVLAALTEVDYPEQVLAITFTRKAAAEIRNRLNEALQLAQNDTPPDDAYARQLWELARKLRHHSEQRGWELENNPQRIRASTIDSLNRELAAQMPILSGLGGPVRALDDARELYRVALQQALQHEDRHSADTQWQQSRAAALRLGKNRLDSLLENLSPLLAQREHWAAPAIRANTAAVQASAQELLDRWIRSSLEEIDRKLARAPRMEWLRILQGLAKRGELSWASLSDLTEWPSCDPSDLESWQTLSRSFLTKQGRWRSPRGLRKDTGFPDPTLQKRAKALLPEFCTAAPQLENALQRLLLLPAIYDARDAELATHLLCILKRALIELRLHFANQSCCDHTEFALAARHALRDDDRNVAATADARFRHILVDEMQDTSNAQIELLEALVSDWQPQDGRSLFLVGDPQQSIYLFRHARVEKFSSLLKPGAQLGPVALEPIQLQQNFRSDGALVDWTNKHIGAAFRTQNSPIEFAPSTTHSQGASCPSGPDSRLIDAVSLYRHDDDDAEARSAVMAIQQQLRNNPTGTIGVLARQRNHLRTLAQHLRRENIAFSGVELEALKDTPAIRNYLAIVRVLHHPEDDFATLRLLRSPGVASSWAQLDALVASTPELRWSQRVRHSRTAAQWPGLALLQHALTQAESKLHSSGDLARSARQLFHALRLTESLSVSEHRDVQRFEHHLAQHCRRGQLHDEMAFERSLDGLWADTDAAQIELMTVHKSKGLEFDAVLLLGMGRSSTGSDTPLLRWHPDSGGDALAINTPDTGEKTVSLYQWLSAQQRDAEDAERLRLLYVAVTRARHALHLFLTGKCGRGSLGYPLVDALPWPVQALEPNPEADETPINKPPEKPELQAVIHPRLTTGTAAHLAPGLALPPVTEAAAPSQLSATQPTLFADNDAERLESSLIGTSVHETLERLTRVGLAAWSQQRETMLHALRSGLARRGLPRERRDDALAKIASLVDNAIQGQGRILLAEHPWSASELPVSGMIDGRLIHGVIDRCFERANGELWLVDYKTNAAPKLSPNSTMAALADWHAELAEQYRAQLQRYATLLERLRKSPHRARRMLYLVTTDELLEVTHDGFELL